MPHGDEHIPSEEELRKRAEANEPIVGTPFIDTWADLELPLRGERRKNVIQRFRARARSRRTVEGVASRVASNISTPITNAMKEEIEDRAQARVKAQLEEQVTRSNERQ